MAEKEKKDSKKDKPMTREEALEQALKQIEKAHGKGAIMRLGEAHAAGSSRCMDRSPRERRLSRFI